MTENPKPNDAEYAQEIHDAMRLIQIGNKTKDAQVKRIGQARVRILQDRPTIEDLELMKSRLDS
ncbi:MAG TPA: hypothetical protein VKC53_00160 [Patescibacteria group bacterium]|nr:hypothetical protein [Patescibacteria group bacterium]